MESKLEKKDDLTNNGVFVGNKYAVRLFDR